MDMSEEKRYWLERDFVVELLKQLPLYIFWKNKHSVYLGCNDAFAHSLGLSCAEDIIGKTDYELPTKREESDAYRADDRDVIESLQPKLNIEECQTLPNGQHIVLLTNKVPLFDKNNHVIGVLGIYADITERKKLESELLAAKERAEVANQAKSDFLAVVSHELRIPLTGILGIARLLATDSLPPTQQQYVNDIIYSGEYLQTIVNDVLDFAKLEAGKMGLHPSPLDFRNLLKGITKGISYQIKEKGLKLLVDYPVGLPHLVLGDAKALRHIILNILNNAVKFTERGYISVTVDCAKRTEVTVTLTITIEDTGIGIPKDKLEAIFDRFSQVHTSRTRKYGGTGLGLAISKAYADMMGGKIDVQSECGQGSRFMITLPFQLQAVHAASSPSARYASTIAEADSQYIKQLHLLLVEDDVIVQRVHKAVLEKLGATVDCAPTGLEALEKARAGKYDVIFMDIGLPDISGIEVAQKIRDAHKPNDPMVPIVGLTGYSTQEDKENCLAIGMVEVAIKPVTPDEFQHILNRVSLH